MELTIKFNLGDPAEAAKYAQVFAILTGDPVAPAASEPAPEAPAKPKRTRKAPAKKAPAKKAPAPEAPASEKPTPGEPSTEELSGKDLAVALQKAVSAAVGAKNPHSSTNMKSLGDKLNDMGVGKIPELDEAGQREVLNYIKSELE